MQKSLKWAPAQPQRRLDNIISSKARENGDLIGFVPTYLAEPMEKMHFIMSNEYMRKWFKERGAYEKDTYSKEQIIREESRIKRRFVQRMMTYQKPVKTQLFEENVLRKPPQKGEQPLDYKKFKYKPVCPRAKAQQKNSPEAQAEQSTRVC
uniref:Uncharacterized protein n=1 Tax=Dendroctonus ponderosae TaxID=77166 RepID=A0AAR5Q379_DENPD